MNGVIKHCGISKDFGKSFDILTAPSFMHLAVCCPGSFHQAVTEDIEALAFNTAIARMMEFVNHFTKREQRSRRLMNPFVLLLSPFAPHLAEELWKLLGHDSTLAYEPWPQYDPDRVRDSELEIPIQIKGKVKSRIVVPQGISREELEAAARADEKIATLLAGKVAGCECML